MWIVYGLLSALFTALTSILAKSGMERVDSNLAAGLRIGVAFLLIWVIVFATGRQHGLAQLVRGADGYPDSPDARYDALSEPRAAPF
ncbi:EamA family transporter [Treponema endosymbiont of Eucomonympha sp.]|uniref:EamA family transporter n=1 Tax=Treponema endosymbiont of Eucomonympha sp. TaxID=1580831 RepID=UPI000750E6FC|nr:hypothetical protein [Treponema endosymbiont of Eucomonympha sp.]